MQVGRDSGREQRGAVLVTVALVLVMLMVFSAYVIDIGATYLERRQDQSGADAGALAGAAMLLQPMTTGGPDEVAQAAVEVARLNISPTLLAGPWNALFAYPACTDPDLDTAVYSTYQPLLSNGSPTDCVHLAKNSTAVRVRLPNQVVPTTFARVIGVNSLSTYAVAEAQVILTPMRSIPFAIQNGQGNPEDLLCIRIDRNCQGPANESTRIVDAPQFKNLSMGTSLVCGTMGNPPGDSNPVGDGTLGTRAADNAAMGTDHMILVATGGARPDDCGGPGGTPRLLPNWLYAHEFDNLAGNSAAAAQTFINGIGNGLVWGGPFDDGGPPRLHRYPGGCPTPLCPAPEPSWQTRTIVRGGNYVVDDRPLWDYIRPGAVFPIPMAMCKRDSFDPSAFDPGDPDNTGPTIQHMVNCLTAWNPGNAPLFDLDSNGDGIYDIQLSPRTGVFPITGSPGNSNYPPSPIEGFETGFLQTMYFSASTTCGATCVEYNPGVDPAAQDVMVTGQNLVGMGVFRIQDLMLPPQARPFQTGVVAGEISLIR